MDISLPVWSPIQQVAAGGAMTGIEVGRTMEFGLRGQLTCSVAGAIVGVALQTTVDNIMSEQYSNHDDKAYE